ncbi:MAG: hypothetical protein OXD40_07465 [bacterium]|nr:hypothetical protein [bacterium]
MACPAALMRQRTGHDAMSDRNMACWLDMLVRREILPVLHTAAGVDADEYPMITMQRFRSPVLGDTMCRLCQDGADRQPKPAPPSLREAFWKRAPVDGLTR